MKMNKHRLPALLVALICLIPTCVCAELPRENGTAFARRVQETPLIVIGVSLHKEFHRTLDDLFNVTFLVQCILKGRPTEQIIQIVQAGSLLGRRARQKLDVNREYLVFLEPFFDDTYRPADFREIFYDNELNGLLERTCGLSRTYPFTDGNGNEASLMNKCPPAVSIDCKSDSESNLHVTSYTKPTTTTTTTITATTTTLELPEKDPLDLEALSLLLADNSQESPHSDASFSDGHKSLFSDDAARTNQAKSLSLHMIINLVSLGILHLVS